MKKKSNKIADLVYLAIALTFIFQCVASQTTCGFKRYMQYNESYYFEKTFRPGESCTYIGYCPTGYNTRLDCTIDISWGCTTDRVMISRSGDPMLYGADTYCGRGTVTAVSTGTTICIGIQANSLSTGGHIGCVMSCQKAMTAGLPCVCGRTKTARIVGGQETGINKYPMMAALIDSRETIYCGATIISNSYVITAAHCASPYRLNPQTLFVIVGAHDIDDAIDYGPPHDVAEIIVHKNYNAVSYDYDIALVKTMLVFSDVVSAACLPFMFQNTDMTGKQYILLGWGTTSFGGQTAEKLQEVNVTVISQAACQATYNNVGPRQTCTYAAGKDSCQFDSGGPALYQDPNNGLVFLNAITSNGKICAGSEPAIYTNVLAFLPWIVENAKSAEFCNIR